MKACHLINLKVFVFQYFKSSSKQGPVSFNPKVKPAVVFISVVKIPFYFYFIVLVPEQICILVLLISFSFCILQ